MIFRVEKSRNYTVMSNFHLREKNMSLKAKGLLSWMLSNNDDWDYSIAGIVSNCKENETAIKSALDELRDFGYLEVRKIAPNKDISVFHYEYIVHEQPIENQDIENLVLENLVLENQVQRNTNTRNTKKEDIITINSNNTEFLGKIKNIKKKSLYDKCYDHILEFTNNVGLIDALTEYLKIRLQMKDKPLYEGTWKGMLKKLDKMDNQIDVVNTSIERGWASFFEQKSYSKGKEKFGEDDNIKSVKGEFDSSGETF